MTQFSEHSPAEQLYGAFADSWRIEQARSLLVYSESETTKTFTDRSFPKEVVTFESLDPEARAEAEQVALEAGLIPGTFAYRSAVIDVAYTGNTVFAKTTAESTEIFAEAGSTPVGPAEIIDLAPVANANEAEVEQGSILDFDVLSNDSDPEGSVLRLIDIEASNGTVRIENNRVVYQPAKNFAGQTRVRYTVADAGGNQALGTLDITVNELSSDKINGTGGRDILLGQDSDDTIDGKAGKDFIASRGGNDVIIGGDGIDKIIGGFDTGSVIINDNGAAELSGGGDILTGCGSTDFFKYNKKGSRDEGADLITDFEDNLDKLIVFGSH